MKARAEIRFKFPSRRALDTVRNSLLPEVNKPNPNRAHVNLFGEDRVLTLLVEADDTVALRSALNTYLRWINSMVKVVETLDCLS
jgi:tRNA threonylcarbamoyladenosine modification (KEOPS) complex  Pcc1 subunit